MSSCSYPRLNKPSDVNVTTTGYDYENGDDYDKNETVTDGKFSSGYLGARASGVRALGKTKGKGMPMVSGIKGVYYVRPKRRQDGKDPWFASTWCHKGKQMHYRVKVKELM